MGGKAQPQMPPPIDNSVTEAADKAEVKLEKEKQAAIGTKKKGMYGTILTSGKGVEEEATTSQSLLGGKKYT
ncbi:hypothetical protein [uncultured Mediterranean phage uvMED]|nr:hypothetical protein [uncultured Mediterranean phage uvMED]